MTKADRRAMRQLEKDVDRIRVQSATGIITALQLLREDVLPAPETLPTRQQRRKAERDAAKRKRGAK